MLPGYVIFKLFPGQRPEAKLNVMNLHLLTMRHKLLCILPRLGINTPTDHYPYSLLRLAAGDNLLSKDFYLIWSYNVCLFRSADEQKLICFYAVDVWVAPRPLSRPITAANKPAKLI